MSSFTNPLDLRVLQKEERGRGLYEILSDFEYHVGAKKSGMVITVPVGFETDLASIPFWARWLINPGGLHTKAAVIHDYLYGAGDILDLGVPRCVSRAEADRIFLEAMGVLKVPWLRRNLMWVSVRLGGFASGKFRLGGHGRL